MLSQARKGSLRGQGTVDVACDGSRPTHSRQVVSVRIMLHSYVTCYTLVRMLQLQTEGGVT